jgi:hypothetical protein
MGFISPYRVAAADIQAIQASSATILRMTLIKPRSVSGDKKNPGNAGISFMKQTLRW